MRRISLAVGAYDRTLPLVDGRIRPEGVELTAMTLPVEEIFYRTATYREFDVSEMSLSSYMLTHDRGAPFVAIPVFPSRAFRHNGIYVNTNAGIDKPEDLRGKSVGIPEYQVTAAVWIRGILAELHGLPPEAVRYRTGGLHSPGRSEKIEIAPPGIDIRPIAKDETLADMLVNGEIDALYTPRTPRPFADGDSRVRRLFADPRAAEIAYFAATRIFPIMHTIVIRREVYENDRWLARSLFKAFQKAKDLVTADLSETAALTVSLPFSYREAELTRELMGEDFWAYGVEPNRHVIETLMRYSYEQGLAQRLNKVEELFAPETLTEFVV
jgi:4,5-dihydroxyphthalate decarboxylase